MKAEALIGKVLGTCTLQKLIGQGGMGAVFLAQQSRPRRQVAVKILLPMAPLSPHQLAAFLERFRRETDAAASLEHPNIVPVHEYGERDGIAYLVMPYISGGTLRDEMERQGPLPLALVVNYLDQIAAALDFAHENGVIHRDIKPANILMTPEGRLLLTDFGLVKIVAEGRAPQVRLTGAGAPVGTPDYMAPEQVIGEEVDSRADLYSLGVILYQMVTGTTPFQGETPMQIAAQHLQIPPPSPQMLRQDLPIFAEQVMLKALAKRPADRYRTAQDLANAFRQALVNAGVQVSTGNTMKHEAITTSTSSSLFVPKGGIGPLGLSAKMPTVNAGMDEQEYGGGNLFRPTGILPAMTAGSTPAANAGGGLLSKTGMFPTVGSGATASHMAARAGGGLLSRTGKFPQVGGTGMMPAAGNATGLLSREKQSATAQVNATKVLPAQDFVGTADQAAPPTITEALGSTGFAATTGVKTPTGALANDQAQGTRNTMKLTGPAKVVKVPVAGQPGQYITGILPSISETKIEPLLPTKKKRGPGAVQRAVAMILAIVIVLGAGGAYVLSRNQTNQQPGATKGQHAQGTPDTKATAAFQTTATAQANVLLSDPLSRNISGWAEKPTDGFEFRDGAYHITDRDKEKGRATVLPSGSYSSPLGYTLTMYEVKGDDTSDVNSFGMIFCYSQQSKNGKVIAKFYTFEMVNKTGGGKYQFWKYDNTNGDGPKAWTKLWDGPFGPEFHQGQGPKNANTVKVFMNNKTFTFIVNGKTIKNMQDASYSTGTVGMIVNLDGTEIAFSNLLLTRN